MCTIMYRNAILTDGLTFTPFGYIATDLTKYLKAAPTNFSSLTCKEKKQPSTIVAPQPAGIVTFILFSLKPIGIKYGKFFRIDISLMIDIINTLD